MIDVRSNNQKQQLLALYDEMRPLHLYPLWEVLRDLVTPEPISRALPAIWRYQDVRAHLIRAGDLISAEQAERRVLILENPGLSGEFAITPRLYAGLQLVLPGEIAPCHRHSQSALRFVMEGTGAYTAVDGERAQMNRFDLILTPNWHWHDHGNPSHEPVIWLDGLDIPLVRAMDAQFAERLSDKQHAVSAPPGTTAKVYGRSMRPVSSPGGSSGPPKTLFHYPYSEWREALSAISESSAPDAHLGHALQFHDPVTGGAVMQTLSAQVRHIPAGFETKLYRSTESAVFTIVEGAGQAEIGGETYEVGECDVLVAPSWTSVRWQASNDLVVFGFSDRTVQEKLGLFREAKR